MTAFSSIYTSLTGMLSYSEALNVVSDNVANLNSPGFKANDVLFRDLPPGNQDLNGGSGSFPLFPQGNGSQFAGVERNFSEGPFQTTGNPFDLSINGSGFFVLNQGGQQAFTQAGQFTFDSHGFLVDSVTGARVQGYATKGNAPGGGTLGDIQISNNQVNPAVPTTKITFTGNLNAVNSNPATPSAPVTASATINNVIDAQGNAHTLTVQFTAVASSTPTAQWTVQVTDEKGNTLLPDGSTIEFNGSGQPLAGFNSLQVTVGGQNVTLSFGDPGASTGTTSFSGGAASTIAGTADGTLSGTLTGVTVDANGILQLAFSNGATTKGPQLAIATFSDPQELINLGRSLFRADPSRPSATPQFGSGGNGGVGQIVPGQLELSNVNLSEEFSTIVVLQNGYQGSSEVLNVSTQLLNDLYKNLSGSGQ